MNKSKLIAEKVSIMRRFDRGEITFNKMLSGIKKINRKAELPYILYFLEEHDR